MDPQQQNNGFGPLSKRRGKSAKVSGAIILVVMVLPYVSTMNLVQDKKENKDDFLFFAYVTGCLLLSFIIGKLMQKICLFWEEMQHKETRYSGSWMRLLKSTFAFGFGDYIFAFFSVFLLTYALQVECTTFCRAKYFWLFCLNSCWFAVFSFIVGSREPSIVEVSQINERENKNVADGLAWSYYFDYLKLVLPKLDEQIGKSAEYRYKVTRKKLYILLPKNCYTYETIDKADPRVTIAGNLEPYEMNRGGILKRVYRHTVHRIEMLGPDGSVDEYHLVLEYAMPLMSLYDMSMNAEAGLSREQRDEQVVLFIRKLKEILDKCLECQNKYELVPFSGQDNQIADVLVQKIAEADVAIEA
ncbi:stimulator of interferon genes protein-like [Acropora millepora]|uniref:stimulator of interferon genes protein-like n=1 Tax=Acropora millepora TaxID=45264 RepID=UPI001CF3A5D3|nr:stimulator of interferon genes protein-like [Acropora millepora]XP_044173244.1 stimulator of interferon genes protein-like [Acropora millepora]